MNKAQLILIMLDEEKNVKFISRIFYFKEKTIKKTRLYLRIILDNKLRYVNLGESYLRRGN